MNRFGVNLTGKQGIYKKEEFYKQGAQKATRTFVFEGGPGCQPTSGVFPGMGLLFGAYTVSGRWTADGDRDILDIRAFECYLDAEGREVKPVEENETTEVEVCPAKSANKPAPAPVTEPAAPAPVAAKPAKASAAPTDGKVNFDAARCVELFKGGAKVSDIAVAMGYERGQGNNRVRGALKAAGVYN